VDTISLSADNDWAYTFTELPKYDETDGHEIEYTVEETAVEGYTTGISGTAGSGFTITNTITGKVSVPVTKKWVGTPTDSVTIQLFADGKQIDSVVLNKDNQWQYTFTDLDQYKDGKEITYTIQEEAVKGYKVTYAGNAKEGFIVTNTQNTPKKEPKKKDPTKQKGLQTGVQTNQSTPIVFGVIIVALLICLAVYIYKRSKKNQ
jgi:LPXTG-motif cell wall-anchored protein